jgi:alginate O-acetyltransferase complex protein AlgI
MAIGLGIMFAIRMPLNFNSPYKALSIIDFWQRWHMTLTRYVTLLVYNPLSLSIARHRRQSGLAQGRDAAMTLSGFMRVIAIPTFATTLVVGIWHGAGLQFVIYGALHGAYLCVNHVWRLFHKPFVMPAKLQSKALYSVAWRAALTYCSVLIAMILFRARGVSDAAALLAGMVGLHGGAPPLSGIMTHTGYVLVLAIVAFVFPNIYQILNEWSPALTAVKPMRTRILAWRPVWQQAAGFGALLGAAALYSERAVRFLYFQF